LWPSDGVSETPLSEPPKGDEPQEPNDPYSSPPPMRDPDPPGGGTTEPPRPPPPANPATRDLPILYFNFPPELDTSTKAPTGRPDPREDIEHITLDPQKPQNPSDKTFKCPSVKVPKVNKLHKPQPRLPTIAYSIVAHKRADLLRAWLQLAYDKDNFYMIHVDSKSGDEFWQEVEEIATKYENVQINPERYHTTYFGWSVMWNHISNYLRIKQLNQTRDYYINVSGMELPIQTRKEIRFFLGEHEPTSFVQEYCTITETRSFWVSWTWAEVKAGLVVVNKEGRNLPAGVVLHYGSQYSILHHNIVDWMLDDLRMLHLIYWLRNTKTPEDIFFVTAARSSPHKNNVFIFNNMKYVETNQCCTGFRPTRSTPCTLGVCDMERINASASLYLSRVDSEDDPEMIPHVLALLTAREEKEVETKKVKRLPLTPGQTLDPEYAPYA